MTPKKIIKARVTVPLDLAKFADAFGRRLATFRKGGRNNNNLKATYEESIYLNTVGARGEAGLYCFFGGEEGGAEWYTEISNSKSWGDTPDIIYRGNKYDVKGIDQNHLALCVWSEKVHPDWRYLLVGTEHWRIAILLGWCTGAEILTSFVKEKVPGRRSYFIEQGDPMLKSIWDLRPELTPPLSEPDGYILQDKDDDYVLEVESTEWETVQNSFKFTKDRSLARVFDYNELFSRQATNPIGIQFIRGFSGGRVICLGSTQDPDERQNRDGSDQAG